MSRELPLVQAVHSSGWTEEVDDADEQLRLEARALASDPINREILRRLQDDGRMSYSQIARELGTSEPTVRNRVNRMVECRLMRIIAVVDPVALGHTVYAMVGLDLIAGADPRRVARTFTDCGEVTYVLFAAGRYDLLIEVICAEQDAFRRFLLERCYGNPDIASVEPMMGLQLFKSMMKWGRP
ncbi:MAG: Lrp/AsnC family transcriptional regulator [Rhodospirillales bacterium]|nr:Lrp/AsnC family transcriptional regulator [Rhodospirillales bacterium]